jgi:hypothetical protein
VTEAGTEVTEMGTEVTEMGTETECPLTGLVLSRLLRRGKSTCGGGSGSRSSFEIVHY